MSLSFFLKRTLSGVSKTIPLFNQNCLQKPVFRQISFTSLLKNKEAEAEENDETREVDKKQIVIIPVETSIKYLKSKAYNTTYGDQPVWKNYRRNHKGAFAPRKTRKTCIRQGKISTGNPCPICRDEYLVLSPDNIDLLKQFISPYDGQLLSYSVTGLCQKRYQELRVALDIAKDRGLITYDVPFREYDYSEYIKN